MVPLTSLQRACLFVLAVGIAAWLLTMFFFSFRVRPEVLPQQPDGAIRMFEAVVVEDDELDKDDNGKTTQDAKCTNDEARRVYSHQCDQHGVDGTCATCSMVAGTARFHSSGVWPHAATECDKEHFAQFKAARVRKCGSVLGDPLFAPDLYLDPRVERFNNCLSYAWQRLNQALTKTNQHKVQPGFSRGLSELDLYELTCANLIRRVCDDFPDAIYSPDTQEDAPCGYFKVYLLLAPEEDYHWVLQHDGFCSHKPGASDVTTLDSGANFITKWQDATWDYSATGGPNYSVTCGCWFAPIPERQLGYTPITDANDDVLPEDYIPPHATSR